MRIGVLPSWIEFCVKELDDVSPPPHAAKAEAHVQSANVVAKNFTNLFFIKVFSFFFSLHQADTASSVDFSFY